jgi:hypothetical protein
VSRDTDTSSLAFRLFRQRRHPAVATAFTVGFQFRGSMAGLYVPLSMLHLRPYESRCMTRSQCGSLPLHCMKLSLTTPCRFSRRTEIRNKLRDKKSQIGKSKTLNPNEFVWNFAFCSFKTVSNFGFRVSNLLLLDVLCVPSALARTCFARVIFFRFYKAQPKRINSNMFGYSFFTGTRCCFRLSPIS